MDFIHFLFNPKEDGMLANYFFALLISAGCEAGLVKTWLNGSGFRYIEFFDVRVAWRV